MMLRILHLISISVAIQIPIRDDGLPMLKLNGRTAKVRSEEKRRARR